jgi:translocator protein
MSHAWPRPDQAVRSDTDGRGTGVSRRTEREVGARERFSNPYGLLSVETLLTGCLTHPAGGARCAVAGIPQDSGKAVVMPENDDRSSRRRRKLRQAGAWAGAAALYAAAQGLSAWAAQRQSGRGTRPQYSQFERPAFAPPGAAFPVVWSALNLTTATSAWRIWRAPESAAREPSRGEVLAWWAAAILIRSGYVPLAFGRRRLWAATADAALLFAVMARYALLARRIDQPAALLAVPEVAWTGFATVLSTTVAAINSK